MFMVFFMIFDFGSVFLNLCVRVFWRQILFCTLLTFTEDIEGHNKRFFLITQNDFCIRILDVLCKGLNRLFLWRLTVFSSRVLFFASKTSNRYRKFTISSDLFLYKNSGFSRASADIFQQGVVLQLSLCGKHSRRCFQVLCRKCSCGNLDKTKLREKSESMFSWLHKTFFVKKYSLKFNP